MRFLPKISNTTFFCFSPPVMLITLVLEFIFALYVLFTSIWRRSSVVIIALLVCLSIFQLAEFQVCTGDHTVAWMRLGYVAIILLPALGIHLVSLITNHKWVRNLAYLFSFGLIGAFLLDTQSIQSTFCGGNYVLINTTGFAAQTYFPLYYSIALIVTALDISWFIITKANQSKRGREERTILLLLLGGLATFVVPTGAVYLLSPSARHGVPSIMCGFAVFLAITLTLFVYPRFKKLDI